MKTEVEYEGHIIIVKSSILSTDSLYIDGKRADQLSGPLTFGPHVLRGEIQKADGSVSVVEGRVSLRLGMFARHDIFIDGRRLL